ncbi:YueI family protein [Halalkalibacter sp. APA_J-10(15)]|uniref:YueI family protein n=1 Tax=unclassified Halalkalibacter TaxID=2893063 RepID=UPI001FF2EC60|nr:YueI family protein [Halalkalibacter sp. APA_J-10(15)]MCK0471510.1 YueI family protein [Halalkalibacter sp. APA_J-10(15)]
MDQKMKDILDRGVFGAPEIKAEERNVFLTTIIERIYIALTKRQVYKKGAYPEVIAFMKKYPNAHLYVNSDLSYQHYSNYLQEATKHHISYTIVNSAKPTSIGLVLAHPTQVVPEKEIFLKDDLYKKDMKEE